MAQPATARAGAGAPVEAYAPSPQGPPVARDPDMPPSAARIPLAETDTPATIRRVGYHPVVLPPPSPPRMARRWRLSRSALAALALFAVLGLVAGLVARGGNVPIPGLVAAARQPTATATTKPACPAAPLAHTTAPALGSLQLTTGLKDSKHHDYRPVNDVTRFASGTEGYVTFRVLTAHAGTADVLVCTPGSLISGTPVRVPAGSAGLYVEFPLSFGGADVGRGMVTISWNGAVVANQGFTVTG